jgi:hypothetical protein
MPNVPPQVFTAPLPQHGQNFSDHADGDFGRRICADVEAERSVNLGQFSWLTSVTVT